jgi:hypothetical protein
MGSQTRSRTIVVPILRALTDATTLQPGRRCSEFRAAHRGSHMFQGPNLPRPTALVYACQKSDIEVDHDLASL